MNRSEFLWTVGAAGVAGFSTSSDVPSTATAGVDVPDTQLAREATAIAQSCEPVEIFNHSLRTFLFATVIAKAKNVLYDPELLYVASILHDTGLTAAHMSSNHPFEVDGANVAAKLLDKYGVTGQKRDLVWDAVALHDNGGIAQHKQAIVVLVNSGVGADFGDYAELISRDQLLSIFKAAPRLNFMAIFLDAASAVARKKPLSTAHSFVADIGYRRVPGFKLPNFCDEVSPDPFAGY